MCAWVRSNFANANTVSQNDFFDISKNVQYDINEKNVLTDTWSYHLSNQSKVPNLQVCRRRPRKTNRKKK